MPDRPAPPWEEIKGLIARVDEICRESAQTRDRADHAMRRRPIWPDPSPPEAAPPDPPVTPPKPEGEPT
jgi:hypothetical protein